MGAQYVDLVLLEQSVANAGCMNRPFADRLDDVAQKTGGTVLFDVRVDGNDGIQRMAALAYGADGVVAIFMDGNADITSMPVDGDSSDALIAELVAWCRLPMAEQISRSYLDAATTLIAEIGKASSVEYKRAAGA